MKRAMLSFLSLVGTCPVAQAQDLALETGIRFSLKRPSSLSPFANAPQTYHVSPPRMEAANPVNADDRDQEIQIRFHKSTQRFLRTGAAMPLDPHMLSRSRMTRYVMEDRWLIRDQVTATMGWHGIKISNRNANVTVGSGRDRLRTRDWFLPHANLVLQTGQALRLSLDYAEKLRAYSETGISGPMGLDHDTYLQLRRTLKPETQSRVQMQADWTATPALNLSLALHGGRLDDQLRFTGRGILPVNSGSARIEGAILAVHHQATPQWQWSVRYSGARVRVSGGAMEHEHSLSAGTTWQNGPWRAALALVRNSAPALPVHEQRAMRIEAGVDYALAEIGGRPLTMSLHMSDPDRLMSGAFARDDLSGSLRASDQVRTVMASARLGW